MVFFNYLKLITLALGFCVFQSVGAESVHEKTYQKLAKMNFRPSLSQVHRAFKGRLPLIRSTNESVSDKAWREWIYEHLPMAIAKLELIYPGATWAALGRDAASIADLLEAFYMGMGESSDRVVRINASTETFEFNKYSNAAERTRLFMKMLKGQGLNLNNKKMRPFVFIDRTSYSNSGHISQSTQLMEMIYDHFTKTTRLSAEKLFKKVSMVTSTTSTRAMESTDPVSFFKDVKMSSVGMNYPNLILSVTELKSFTDKDAWHDSFGRIVKYPNGYYGGTLGVQEPESVKIEALRTMINGFNTVTSLKFQNAVRKAAKSLGYDFDEHLKTYGRHGLPTELSEIGIDVEELVQIRVQNYFSNWWVTSRPELEVFMNAIVDIYTGRISNLVLNTDKFEKMSVETQKDLIAEKSDTFVTGIEQMFQSFFKNKTIREVAEFESLFTTYLNTFEPFDASYSGKSYLSLNAAEIESTFKTIVAEKNHLVLYTTSYLRLLESTVNLNIISKKDYRRLVLYALSVVADEDSFFTQLPELFKQSPLLKDTLIKHDEVFMTSERYESLARKSYLRMLKLNLLPVPAKEKCDKWLLDSPDLAEEFPAFKSAS